MFKREVLAVSHGKLELRVEISYSLGKWQGDILLRRFASRDSTRVTETDQIAGEDPATAMKDTLVRATRLLLQLIETPIQEREDMRSGHFG